jgi:hypothetical protein
LQTTEIATVNEQDYDAMLLKESGGAGSLPRAGTR